MPRGRHFNLRDIIPNWIRNRDAVEVTVSPGRVSWDNLVVVDEATTVTPMVEQIRQTMDQLREREQARMLQYTVRDMGYSEDAQEFITRMYQGWSTPQERGLGTEYPYATMSQRRASTRRPLSTHVEALASWEEALINPSVGNPHTTDEGGTMPEPGNGVATIEVQPTYFSQREIFDRLGIAEGLMASLDVDNWTRHLEALRNGFTPGTFNVEVGSYAITGYPTAQVNGESIRIGSVSIETAQQIVASASNNRITIAPLDGNEDLYCLHTLSALEDTAFVAMYGPVSARTEVDPAGTRSIAVSGLRDMMRYYSEFRSSHRRDAIRNALQTRMRESIQGSQTVKPATEWTTERAQKFGEFFSKIKANLVVTPDPFNDIDILPHGTLASRFWGIEIEAVDIAGVRTPRYWELKGDGSLRDLNYESLPSNSGTPPGADPATAPRTDHDEDCESRNPEDGCTCGECYFDCSCGYEDELYAQSSSGQRSQVGEWNSPPLRSFHSRGLEYVCSQIEYRRTNHTPGVHVHIASDDLTPDQVVNVGLMYTAFEPLFEAEYKRGNTRTYCKSLDTAGLVERFNLAKRAKAPGGSLATMAGTSDRYSTVNTQALRGHGTIEFRAMGARYNYEFLIRWSHFLRELVNMAKADIPQKAWKNVKTFRDLIVVMSKYGKETPTPSWASDSYSDSAVVEKLGTESRRVPNQENIRNVPTVFEDYTQTELIFN